MYKEGSRDYGSDVIETIVKFIDSTERTDFVVVLAGYKDKMEKMMKHNMRLYTRIGNWIDFPDYEDDELVRISETFASKTNYSYGSEAKEKFSEYMQLRKEFPYFSNARTVRNAVEQARKNAATRALRDIIKNNVQMTEEEVYTLLPVDFQVMIDKIKDLPRDSHIA